MVKSASVGRTGLTPRLWPVRWGFEVDPVVLGEVLEGFVGLVLLLLLASVAVVLVEVLYHVAGALQRVVLIGDGADDYDGVEEGPDRLFDRVGRGPRRDGLLARLVCESGCRGFWNGIRRWRAFPQFTAVFGLDAWGANHLHSSGQ